MRHDFPFSIRFNGLSRTLLVGLCLGLGLSTVSGCTGCWKDDLTAKKDEDEKKKKKKLEETKPDFEMATLQLLPSDPTLAAASVKPGHWAMGTQRLKANHFDFQAELQCTPTDKNGQPFEIALTAFSLSTSRPVALPKGQEKVLETLVYAPPRQKEWRERNVWFRRELATARGGRVAAFDVQGTVYLPTYQYLFLILATEPDLYGYVRQLTSILAPSADFSAANTEGRFSFYQVTAPTINKFIPLPSNPLTMTSLAYVLWDGIDPNLFTSDQAQAFVDWLHWGGQLLVSGPESLDTLRGSFLEEYLPAVKTESLELTQDDFQALNEYWTIADERGGERRTLQIAQGKPILGVRLVPHPDASDLAGGGGGLVFERRVGQGRIVVTGFSLAARELIKWGGSFDGFFNNGLMRRPRRRFEERDGHLPHLTFADYPEGFVRDARFVSNLRFFSRDAGHLTNTAMAAVVREVGGEGLAAEDLRPEERIVPRSTSEAPSTQIEADTSGDVFGGYLSMPQSGVAGWNDRSGVSDKARDALRDAAGISIPNSTFVLKVLAVYLLILAPLNFGLFWLLGRIEWAWVATPALAVLGAIAVVRLAQLDIGFARSTTEVATLEIQGSHSRGHLTRYTGLYTSLSTSYDLEFESDASLALPFATDPNFRVQDSLTNVRLRRDELTALRGFQVPSNKTGMTHAEQMLDLAGPIALRGGESVGWEVRNESQLTLRDAAVWRLGDGGRVEIAWLGDLAPQTAPRLQFQVQDGDRPPQWNESPVLESHYLVAQRLLRQWDENKTGVLDQNELVKAEIPRDLIRRYDLDGSGTWSLDDLHLYVRKLRVGTLNLGALADIATRRLRLRPGDYRLVGWTDQDLPGLEIKPVASQSLRRTLVVAHLARRSWPAPGRDLNTFRDVFLEKQSDDDSRGPADAKTDN